MPLNMNLSKIGNSYVGNRHISYAYLGNILVWLYDNVPPILTINTPLSSSASNPTYTTGGTTYRVSGTAADLDSGVSVVYVNGYEAELSGDGTWYRDITITKDSVSSVDVYAIDNAKNRTDTYRRYVFYDATAPNLVVTSPVSTSSTSPTYIQSDTATTYTASGTISDASGISSVQVNGSNATLDGGNWSIVLSNLSTNTTHTITVVATDKSGRTTTAKRYLRVETYYQQAARTAGASLTDSLDGVLSNSSACLSLANNSSAVAIMKEKYSAEITLKIDKAWSEGLNALAYKCGCKYYIFYNGNECSYITGGWDYQIFNPGNNYAQNTGSSLLVRRQCCALTKNKINLYGRKISWDYYYDYSWMSDEETEWYQMFCTTDKSIHFGYHGYYNDSINQRYIGEQRESDLSRTTKTVSVTYNGAAYQAAQAYTDGGLYVYKIAVSGA